jgi:hypothetical protein
MERISEGPEYVANTISKNEKTARTFPGKCFNFLGNCMFVSTTKVNERKHHILRINYFN